jgi:hypothetical protein
MEHTSELKKVKRYTYNIHTGELLEDLEGEWIKLDDITELVRTILKMKDEFEEKEKEVIAASGEFKNLLKHISG